MTSHRAPGIDPLAAPRREAGRFDRQERFGPLGPEGQRRLESARVLVVGCGALGGVLAQTLVRSGVGEIVLVDRDVVELSNLPRQVLFEDRHAAEGTPKVVAAVESLARIGGPSRVVPHALHLDAANVEQLAGGCDLVLDGTDNLATRYLLNDYCVEGGIPWVYAGVVGAEGLVLAILPGKGPCLRCIFPDPPPPGSLPTCDSAGVIPPAVAAVASAQAGLALRILAEAGAAGEGLRPALLSIDVWGGRASNVHAERQADCPCCGRREFPFLHSPPARPPVVLCGRNTVQIQGPGRPLDLAALAEGLDGVARDVQNIGILLRFSVDAFRLTVFPDGRALVEGTEDVDRARSVYDRFVGS